MTLVFFNSSAKLTSHSCPVPATAVACRRCLNLRSTHQDLVGSGVDVHHLAAAVQRERVKNRTVRREALDPHVRVAMVFLSSYGPPTRTKLKVLAGGTSEMINRKEDYTC